MEISQLAVVIPCKDEERWIGACVDALLSLGVTEIVVVDNGSTDGTLRKLQKYAGRVGVFVEPQLNVAGLRNFGASKTSRPWLAFIDADVIVDPEWGSAAAELVRSGNEHIISGSTCGAGLRPNWLQAVWHAQLVARDRSGGRYINSGNMMLSRALFERVGGFDESCETGEDVKLCTDAVRIGARVYRNPGFSAQHMGYPTTISGFYRRERWHGMSMQHDLRTPWRSRDLLLASYVLALGCSLLFALSFFRSPQVFAALALAAVVPFVLLSLLRSARKRAFKEVVQLAILYGVYAVAHADSLLRIITRGIGSPASRLQAQRTG